MSINETKTTAPKTETPANPFMAFGSFDPMAAWTKMMTESFARMGTFADHYASLEKDATARVAGAVATWAQMSQDAIAYGAQLSTEARKLSLDAWKKLGVSA